MKKLAVLIGASLFSFSVLAADVTGFVTAVSVKQNRNIVKFELSSPDKGHDCNASGWFSISLARQGGPTAFDIVLDAYHRRSPITVRATDNDPCGDEGGVLSAQEIILGIEKSEMAKFPTPGKN